VKRGHNATAGLLAPRGTRVGRKIAAAIDALLSETNEHLFAEPPRTVTLPPTGRCLARRVSGTALELWYVEGPDFVALHALKIYGS
jgi:hypothetical protein